MTTPICTTKELAEHLGANEERFGSIRRRVYKDTACGASLGILTGEKWEWHDSSNFTGLVFSIAISGYVEDCDAECPVHTYKTEDGSWQEWLDRMLLQVDVDADVTKAEWDSQKDDR